MTPAPLLLSLALLAAADAAPAGPALRILNFHGDEIADGAALTGELPTAEEPLRREAKLKLSYGRRKTRDRLQDLSNWASKVVHRDMPDWRKDLTVEALDQAGKPLYRIVLKDALPRRYEIGMRVTIELVAREVSYVPATPKPAAQEARPQ
jgi:hypothetical protein